jgi:menaquinone-9 beta-reductase
MLAAERLIAIGDAPGYLEPFTSEGMAIALESALAALPLAVIAAHEEWRPSMTLRWQAWHSSHVRRRQWICRGMTWALRRDWATSTMLQAVQIAPWLSHHLLSHLNRSGSTNGVRRPRFHLRWTVESLNTE